MRLPKFWVFDPTISGLLGWQTGEVGRLYNGGLEDEYYYWNAGLALTVEKLTLDFRYWDTDLDAGWSVRCRHVPVRRAVRLQRHRGAPVSPLATSGTSCKGAEQSAPFCITLLK